MIAEARLWRSGRPFVSLDLELQNLFLNVEWAAIHENRAELFPKFDKWFNWKHRDSSTIYLPSGGNAFYG